MARWRFARIIVRTLGYSLVILLANQAIFYIASTRASNWSNPQARSVLLHVLAGLIVALCLIPAGDALIRPISWKGYTRKDFARETQVRKLLRQACRQRKKLTVSLPVSRNCRLKCTYPARKEIWSGFWKFVISGKESAAVLTFYFDFSSHDPESTEPLDQRFTVPFFGGSYHGPDPGADHKLGTADFNWLVQLLTEAVEQFSRRLGRLPQV